MHHCRANSTWERGYRAKDPFRPDQDAFIFDELFEK
jgi:hypothetical protein